MNVPRSLRARLRQTTNRATDLARSHPPFPPQLPLTCILALHLSSLLRVDLSEMMNRRIGVIFIFLAEVSAFGQAAITDIGSDTKSPTIKIAPGQVVTLRVRGLTKRFDATQVATSVPLPVDFDGVSVTLRQN